MLIRFFACALVWFSGIALAADASQEVTDAATKLSDAGNYSWRSVTNDTGNDGSTLIQDGKTDKSGYTILNLNSGNYYLQFVLKSGAGVINLGEGWKTADDLADQRRAAKFLTSTVRGFKSPAVAAQQIASHLKDLRPAEDAYVAAISGKDASDVLGPMANLRGGREMSNAKATIRFWVRDGVLTKYQVHATYTVSRNGNDMDFDRTTTVDFSDVGTTSLDVPDEARKKLG
jgi:hypothetical protein